MPIIYWCTIKSINQSSVHRKPGTREDQPKTGDTVEEARRRDDETWWTSLLLIKGHMMERETACLFC